MSQEIVYTSAPQGLKTGSKGFCTVISTEGITDYFAERLEMLSGYRHAFSPGDSKAPVNYSHLQIKVGRHDYHVLSRVCDAGFDYSQRSNKLAHHVALEASELVPAGPAAVLASRGFCITKWDGTTKMLPQGRLPTAQRAGTGTCPTWKSLTGDAGWAGVLAETAMVPRPRPVSVIFRAGTDALALVVEAMCLLPAQKRWEVSFNTYYTKAVAGSDCLWRFVLDGTKQAEALRAKPNETIIDLAQRPGQATGGHLVDLARTGKQKSDPSQAFLPGGGSGKSWPTRSPRPQAATAVEDGNQDFDSYDPYQGIPELPESHRRKKKTLTRVHIGIIIGLGITFAAASALLAGAWFSGRLSTQRSPLRPPSSQPTDSTIVPDIEEEDTDTPVEDDSASAPGDPGTADDTVLKSVSDSAAGTLPVFDLSTLGKTVRVACPVDDPMQCKLTLLGNRLFFTDQLTLAADDDSSDAVRSWNVELSERSSDQRVKLGTFQVGSEQLSFHRSDEASDVQCRRLSHCALRIEDGTQRRYLALRNPHEIPARPLGFADGRSAATLSFELPDLVNGKAGRVMQFDLQLDSSDSTASKPGSANNADESFGRMKWPKSALTGLTAPGTARLTIHEDLTVSVMRMIRPSQPGGSRRISQKNDRNLAQIDVEVRVEEPSAEVSKHSVLVQVTPTVFMQPIKTASRDYARRFIQGDESLISGVESLPWAMKELASKLSPDAVQEQFVDPVVDEYNVMVDSPNKQIPAGKDALRTLRQRVDDYYRKRPIADSRSAKVTLDRLIEIVDRKRQKLSKLEQLSNQLSKTKLHVRGYLMLDGQKVTVMKTKAAR